jgi:hypothetical protein
MTTEPPWTLFVLDETIDTEVSVALGETSIAHPSNKYQYINRSLTVAHDRDASETWNLWVATNSYEDMPKATGERQSQPEATKPPVEGSFTSPWLGKTVEECAKWLQDAPYDVAGQREYFAAMDRFSKEDDTVLACRVWKDGGVVKVAYYPLPTKYIAMYKIVFDDATSGRADIALIGTCGLIADRDSMRQDRRIKVR